MPKFVIESDIPGAGQLSAAELQAVSQKSCGVLRNMGPQIQWVHSYVTDDKIYCVYIAEHEAQVLNTRPRAGSRRTACPRCGPSSTRPPRSRLSDGA